MATPQETPMTTETRNENRDAKTAYSMNAVCPYCRVALALGYNLAVERDDTGRVVGACCADCAVLARCLRCGYTWTPRVQHPHECPACKSRKWATPKEDRTVTTTPYRHSHEDGHVIEFVLGRLPRPAVCACGHDAQVHVDLGPCDSGPLPGDPGSHCPCVSYTVRT